MGEIDSSNQKGTPDLESKKSQRLRGWAEKAARLTGPAFIILLKLGLISLVYFILLFVVLAVRSL